MGLFISIGVFALPDTLQIQTDKESSIVIGTDYASNTNTFGHFNNFVKQPLLSPYVSYYGKRGLLVSGLANFVGNSDSTNTKTSSEFDFQLGYRWNITDHFSIVPSLTHFFYSANSNSLKSEFTDYFQVDLNAEVKWWYTSVSTGYIIGNSNQLIIIPQTGVYIQFDHILSKNNSLTFQPSVSCDFNNQDYYNSYYSKKYLFLKPYTNRSSAGTIREFLTDYSNGFKDFNKLTSALLKEYFNRFFQNHPYYLENMKKLPQNEELMNLIEQTSNDKKFTITSLGLTLPVYYYIGNLVFNFTFSAFKPINQPDYLDSDWVTYSSLGVSYMFGLKNRP